MNVVAEGIEDRETLDLLRELGCDVAQGFLIGHPAAPETLSFPTAAEPSPPEFKVFRGASV